jgi:hypothetical protein
MRIESSFPPGWGNQWLAVIRWVRAAIARYRNDAETRAWRRDREREIARIRKQWRELPPMHYWQK